MVSDHFSRTTAGSYRAENNSQQFFVTSCMMMQQSRVRLIETPCTTNLAHSVCRYTFL